MLQNAPREDKTLAGLGWHGVAAESPTAKFDLTLLLHETPRGLLSSVEFAADLWEASTVRRMLGHLQVLLEGVAERPERALLDLPLMPPAERDQALLDWNRTGVEYPRDATVDALFEAEVDRAPEAIAVVFGESCLSYRELDRRANRLARRLAEAGVDADMPVGLYALRSLEVVVAILGILKAGGAFVPMDPDLPDARLAWVAEDLAFSVVVAAGTSAAGRPFGEAQVVDMAIEAEPLEALPCERLARERSADTLVYAMYTSGSTGRPKGVGAVHRAVARLVKGSTGDLSFGPEHVLLQHSPLSFDASTLELWAPLLNGGRLVVLAPETPSVAQIGEWMVDLSG